MSAPIRTHVRTAGYRLSKTVHVIVHIPGVEPLDKPTACGAKPWQWTAGGMTTDQPVTCKRCLSTVHAYDRAETDAPARRAAAKATEAPAVVDVAVVQEPATEVPADVEPERTERTSAADVAADLVAAGITYGVMVTGPGQFPGTIAVELLPGVDVPAVYRALAAYDTYQATGSDVVTVRHLADVAADMEEERDEALAAGQHETARRAEHMATLTRRLLADATD